MRSVLRRPGMPSVALTATVALTAALTATGALAPAPARAETTTGSISGQLTDAGAPVQDAWVGIIDMAQTQVGGSNTDGAGQFTVADLAPGDYKLQFFVGSLIQWAHQKTSFEQADTFTVTAGATTVVNEELLPTGSIGGVLVNAAGPVAGVDVSAQPLGSTPSFGHGRTDEQGRFEMARLLPGSYRVMFDIGGGQQYHPQQLDPNDAVAVTAVAGQRTEIAETLLPTGSVSGRLVEDGTPVEGAQVVWTHVNGFTLAHFSTDADGGYAGPMVFAGTYRVQFLLPDGRSQYAHGRLTADSADVFAVVEGANTVVDETVLPTGQVAVRATDRLTGAPVAGFCAEIAGVFACTDGEVASFARVPVGRHTVTVFPFGDTYLSGATGAVEVTAGATAEVTVALTPAAIITTMVRDRRSGEPVAGVCLFPVTPILASFGDDSTRCSDEEGRVRVGHLVAGTYTLFARAGDGVHGSQWVGVSGGTGSQFAARKITVAAGQTVDLPPLQLDRAGSITGRVTDKATGQPVRGALVTLLTSHPGVGPTGPQAETDTLGRYTLTGLGPYEWPLHVTGPGYAPQWSGGVPSRLLATPVRVIAGRTATGDAALTKGTAVRGTVTINGQPMTGGAWVVAYDALLGDIAGTAWMPDDTFEMPVLGPTAIRIRVTGSGTFDRWYRDAATFETAGVVLVPSGGSKTLTVTFS